MRAAVNVKHFTGDELCIVQVHHRINDLTDIAHSADGLKTLQKVMGFDFVHRRFYGSESDGVDAYALSGILNLECECNGVQSTFGQNLQYTRLSDDLSINIIN